MGIASGSSIQPSLRVAGATYDFSRVSEQAKTSAWSIAPGVSDVSSSGQTSPAASGKPEAATLKRSAWTAPVV